MNVEEGVENRPPYSCFSTGKSQVFEIVTIEGDKQTIRFCGELIVMFIG